VREEVPSKDERLGEGWTAKRDGELYVYLNKPTIGLPWMETVLRVGDGHLFACWQRDGL
jgi:hypothetical protein